ncbi:hypothetical protein LSTR_LSTR009763 [Laodelphax striatellus]|uniref:BTB domain-containing protein n=1 Tax=Laodelphax striatellus TaxID=195883 RepID=A0A482WPF6_LAOST|nr:hypothetical protein LSTR_LSTR009763 [Laodelphax striatellus]
MESEEREESEEFDFSERIFFSYLSETVGNCIQTPYDLRLNVGDNVIPCHKVLLCQESEFFQLMFNTDMMEKKQDTITLKDVSYKAAKSVINFLYLRSLVVPENEMCEIVKVVDMFQIHILRPVCAEILLNSCSVSNLISIHCLASQYRYHDVADEAFELILQNFSELARTEHDFLEASFELILKIFRAECLCCANENECIRAILSWIQFDVSARHAHLVDLLETIISAEISCWNELEARSYMFANHSDALDFYINWIARGKKQANDIRRSNVRIRGKQLLKVCVAAGGTGVDRSLKHVEVKVPLGADWSQMLPYQHAAAAPAAAMIHTHGWPAYAARNRLLYVLGGEITLDVKSRVVEVFDVMKNAWREMPQLPIGLTCAAATCVDHRLYVSGGYEDFHVVTNKVYYLETDGQGNAVGEWKNGPQMQFRRASHALVNINGVLIAIGGVDSNLMPTNHVEYLLPGKSRWLKMPALIDARSHFACAVFQKKIFVMGGENRPHIPEWQRSRVVSTFGSQPEFIRKHLFTVEMFDTESDVCWEERGNMRRSRTKCAATVLNNRVYLAGGFNETGLMDLATIYNPETDLWHPITSMKFRRANFGLAALNLY